MARLSLRSRLLVAFVLPIVAVTGTGLAVVRVAAPAFYRSGVRARSGADQTVGGRADAATAAELQRVFDDALSEATVIAVAVGLVAAVVLGVIVSRRLTARLDELRSATQRLADGDYRLSLRMPPEPELAQLTTAINTLGAALATTEQARARLMSDLAHELRNPLTTIEGYMEGLLDGVLPATAETYNDVANEAHRLKLLTEDLSFLSKAQEDAVAYRREPVSLAAVVSRITERLRPRFDGAGVELVVDLDGRLPVVVDEARIGQVLTNLLDNALAHTGSGGSVSIEGGRIDQHCRVSVSDTGTGIEPQHLSLVFERFTRYRTGPGLGIGLNIARSIVVGHGGTLTASSPGVGRGATFTLTLPVGAD